MPRLGPRTLIVTTLAMAVLLAALAILEVRWTAQVGRAEGERLKRELEIAAGRIADDFDREIARAFIAFMPAHTPDGSIEERIAEGFRRWSATALLPELVESVFCVAGSSDGAPEHGEQPELWRFDPGSSALEPVPWPREIASLRQRLWADPPRGRAARPFGPREIVLPGLPGLLLAMPPHPPWAPSWVPGSESHPPAVIVAFDRSALVTRMLPELIDAHLGPEPRETQAQVITRTRRADIVYSSGDVAAGDEDAQSDLRRGDVRRPLFSLRLFPDLRAQGFQSFFDDPEIRRRLGTVRGRIAGAAPKRIAFGGSEGAAWTLVLTRREGSVEAAAARLRLRNLGIGLAVVALLGATAALLLASARQMQRLARREMELVAGITHELRTPLAAIGSAADNLADGVVRDAAQVRRYGLLIRSETHRLGSLVAQVLDFASTTVARRRTRRPEPVDVVAVIDSVLADLRFLIEEKGFTVERSLAPDLPHALADAESVRRALDNVIGNALKYGESGRWVGVEVALATGGSAHPRAGRRPGERAPDSGGEQRIEVRVRDRGPGIARAERRRIFEPFYRGDARARHVHGAGLGLAVAKTMLEELGGAIEVEESEPGRGTTLLLTLPTAPAPADHGDRAMEPSTGPHRHDSAGAGETGP